MTEITLENNEEMSTFIGKIQAVRGSDVSEDFEWCPELWL